jgi:hypothetical protein
MVAVVFCCGKEAHTRTANGQSYLPDVVAQAAYALGMMATEP